MMQYTSAPFQPDVYGGKMFQITPETGTPFLVSVANDESEIPALVDFHLNPPKPAPYTTPPVTSVTPRQARLALLAAGLLDQATAAVNAAGGATLITWEYASVFERNDPLIVAIGAQLGLSPEQIDALFTQAATL